MLGVTTTMTLLKTHRALLGVDATKEQEAFYDSGKFGFAVTSPLTDQIFATLVRAMHFANTGGNEYKQVFVYTSQEMKAEVLQLFLNMAKGIHDRLGERKTTVAGKKVLKTIHAWVSAMHVGGLPIFAPKSNVLWVCIGHTNEERDWLKQKLFSSET